MRISLAEEIREISKVAPKDFDPDGLDFDNDQTPAATEHDLLELGYAHPFLFPFFFALFYPP